MSDLQDLPAAPVHVLVVDDHADIRDPLAEYLEHQGLRASTAASAAEMRRQLARRTFDLIVLDIVLPDEGGLDLCRGLARDIDTPVIFLSAMAGASDRVRGLETGADDYLAKPFDPPELVARIRTVLRRKARAATAGGIGRVSFDGWVFDGMRRELAAPGGRQVVLSSGEFQMLQALISHPGTVLSRERLMDLTQRGDTETFDRNIDTQISRLRRKLEADPRRPSLIKTERGNGYLFTAQVRTLAQ